MYVVKGREDTGTGAGLWKGPPPIMEAALDPESSELTSADCSDMGVAQSRGEVGWAAVL